ncbi:hypothetical protein EJ06DRAFT_485851 [Trichodelitschia bisporula]|uniref:Uncharacterized protein n=1 Tax=Trichodelitschia bisporula TaxID=703511 RepID=A0A6G1IB84_9PEZI|nr:hypothetical protein EJ06DRAFT_485851 [Trichodelitschia bisporula]
MSTTINSAKSPDLNHKAPSVPAMFLSICRTGVPKRSLRAYPPIRLRSTAMDMRVKVDNQRQTSNPNKKLSDGSQTAKAKRQSELDRELQEKMAGISGDGGDSGVEFEDGRPVAMKRGVRDNMFRYI